jgi:hypothetical protein
VNPLTLAELKARQAELALRAERKREEWRRLPATARAIELGKQVKALDERAAEYRDLIRIAEGTE